MSERREILAAIFSEVDDSFVITEAPNTCCVVEGELKEWNYTFYVIGIPMDKIVEAFDKLGDDICDKYNMRFVPINHEANVCMIAID